MPKASVLVSIINWNNNAATSDCLSSISKIDNSTQPDVYLTDNHSERELFQIDQSILNSLKSIKIIENTANKGFAGGHNDAIRYAIDNGYDYVCLLNNDTEITDNLVFEKLCDELKNNVKAIAAAPTILSSLDPPKVWYGGGTMDIKASYVHHDNVGVNSNELEIDVKEVSFLTGCCQMISLIDKSIDLLLSEDYFLYWEDADWCARMLNSNKSLLYVPDATILHKTSSSLGITSPRYSYYNLRNRLLFAKKWSSVIRATPGTLWTGTKIVILSLKKPSATPRVVTYVIRAYFDGLRNNTGPLK